MLAASGYLVMFDGNHHIEAGVGITLFDLTKRVVTAVVPVLGYRFEKPHGGLLLRITFTPVILPTKNLGPFPWGGLSAGYSW